MIRNPANWIIIVLLFLWTPQAGAERLSPIGVFDGMIHYEADQLAAVPSIRDYHCIMTETTQRTLVSAREVVEKELYFMVPTFQLEVVDGEPVFYFDDDLLIILLESVNLTRERDAEIDGVECYVIRTTPVDPAYRQYNRTYYVAKDDFRHVRTSAHHSTMALDNLTTQIDYTYGEVGAFTLLLEKVATTHDSEGNFLATATTVYTDYEFGLGLDVNFFASMLEGKEPRPPLN